MGIMTKCWIAAGSQEINTEVDVKLAVVAEVSQGTVPVVGAKVKAEIERPPDSNGDPQPPMELDLMDNGSGADKIKNDGTYARYFSRFTGQGRYSVKCQVVGDEETGTNGGFIGERVYPQNPQPGTPLCCGSNALPEGAKVDPTGNFTRHASGGAFKVTNEVDMSADNIPPGQVNDLKLVEITAEVATLEFTSPGDDLDSDDVAASYTFKFSSTGDNLVDSDLEPVEGGNTKTIKVKGGLFENDRRY